MTFSESVNSEDIIAPNNPYIYYTNSANIEVHLPGTSHSSGLSTLDEYASHEEGETQDYLTSDGFPWATDVQSLWDYPKERSGLDRAYPGITTWASSSGSLEQTWYTDETPVNVNYRSQRKTAQEDYIKADLSSVLVRSKYMFR